MARQARLDVPLSSEQRREIDAMASATGLTATALGRLGIVQLLARRDLVLTGSATTGDDLGAFLTELRAVPPLVGAADQLEEVFSALDMEGGISRDAAGLFECLSIVARARGPIEKRLRVMLKLVDHDGPVSIPRALLTNHHRTTGVQNGNP
jgi:hypothetical protein